MKKSRILTCSIVSLLSAASSYAAAITWTTGGDASGTWNSATFNGTAYSATDDLSIDGTATKTITISSPTTPNSLTVSGTGTTGNTITSNAGNPGTGAITLSGTSAGGTLSKTGTADLVLATPNAFGAVSISSGKFFLNDQNGLGTTGMLTVNSGAASGVSGSYATTTMGQFYYDSSNIDADTTFSKNIAFSTGSATTYGMVMRTNTTTPHTTTLSGNITGGSNITLRLDGSASGDGSSVWSLTGNNSGFAGAVYLNRGRISLASANAAGTGTITLATNTNAAGNLLLNFSGTLANAIIVGTAGDSISPGANSVTLSGVVSNSTGWVKAGTGTLTLTNNNNTLTSTTTVSDGTLLVGGAGRLNTATYSGAVTLTASTSVLDYASSAGNNFSGVISGLGSFRKTGAADITLYANSTYSGGTTLTTGALRVATSNTALGTGPITVTSNTVNTSSSPTLATSNVGGGGLRTLANNIAITNNGTGTTTLTVDGGYYPLTLNGAISGNGKLATTSTGTVTLGGTNTYTGTTTATASGSILQFAKEVSLYNNNTAGTGWTAANIIVNSGATAAFNVGGAGEFTAADIAFLQGLTNVASGTTATAGFRSGSILGLDTTNALGGTFTQGSPIANHVAGVTTDTLALSKLGTGTLVLSGANTYSGGTSLSTGYLQFSTASAIPATGTITVSGNGSLVAAGVYPTVQGWLGDSHLATSSTGSIAITGDSSEAINFTGFNTLGLSATGAATYSGTITPGTGGYFFGGDATSNLTVASTLTGANALTKNGPATLTLTAANTYSGSTTVNAGNFTLTGSGAINGGAVAVTGGAVALTGTSSITGTSVTVSGGTVSLVGANVLTGTAITVSGGAVSVAGTSAINGGTVTVSGGVLSLSGSATLNATNGGAVNIGAGSLSTYSVNAVGASGSTINLTNATTGLVYTGTGETTDRVINFNSASGGGAITANGTGLLTFSNPATTTATAGFSVIFNGIGPGQFVGITQPATTQLINFNKQGGGTWTLTGLNNLKAGAFKADGGVLNFAATATTGTGTDAATITRSGTGGGVLTIASGASVITSTTNTNGILGGWATFNGTDWATTNGNAAAITALAPAGYTPNTWTTSSTNVDVTSSNTASGLLANSLRFNTAGALTQTLATGASILTSGGILVTPNVGANLTTITGGTTLAGGNTTDLIVHQNNTAAGLTIASVITNNTGATGLAKTGGGLLTLTGANTFTGNVALTGGTLATTASQGNGTTGSLGANNTTGRTVTINTGSTLSITSNNVFGGGTQPLVNIPTLVINGGTVTSPAYNIVGNVTLNGGTLNNTNTTTSGYSGFEFRTGSTLSVTGGVASTLSATQADHINGTVTFDVADVTASPLTDLTVSARLINSSNDNSGTAGTLVKAGLGTVSFTSAASASLPTNVTINAGTVLLNGSGFSTDKMVGSGILTVNSGGTLVNNVAHGLGGDNNTMTDSVVVNAGGTLTLNSEQYFNNLTLNGATVNGANQLRASAASNFQIGGTAASTISSQVSLNNAGNFVVADVTGSAATDLTISGVVTSTGAFNKSGAGTLTLSGNNNYTGPTNVNAGTLLISGSIGGASSVTTVASGATLGGRRDLNATGNDNISGSVTINGGGTLLVGDGNSIGANSTAGLSINGALTAADNSQIRLTLGPSGSHTTLLDQGFTWTFSSTQTFSILNFGAQVGVTYDNIIQGLTAPPDVSQWTLTGGYAGNFTYDGSGGVDLVLTTVPEPGTVVSLFGGMVLLLGWRGGQRSRRRRVTA